MDGIAEAAEKRRPGTLVAQEGMVLRPGKPVWQDLDIPVSQARTVPAG
jgi:hypothetical protein